MSTSGQTSSSKGKTKPSSSKASSVQASGKKVVAKKLTIAEKAKATGRAAKSAKVNRSGLPKGSTAAYIKGKSCGRGRHNYVVAKAGTYAVCTKCHSRRTLKASED